MLTDFTKRIFIWIFVSFLLVACSDPEQKNGQAFVIDETLCQFQNGECAREYQGVRLKLSILPHHTPSEKPLKLSLATSTPVQNLTMRVEGRDMFMGVIPVNLSQVNENLYKGTLLYGSCSSGYMVWSAIVSYEVDGTTHAVVFDFLADSE